MKILPISLLPFSGSGQEYLLISAESICQQLFSATKSQHPFWLLQVLSISGHTLKVWIFLGCPSLLLLFQVPILLFSLCVSTGEVATARAAAACDTIMVKNNIASFRFIGLPKCEYWIVLWMQILSYRSTCTIEEVASSCNAVRFFQCYVLCCSNYSSESSFFVSDFKSQKGTEFIRDW